MLQHRVILRAVPDPPGAPRQAIRLDAHSVPVVVTRDHPVGELHCLAHDTSEVRRSTPKAYVQGQLRCPRHHHRLVERHRHFDGLVHPVGSVRPCTRGDPNRRHGRSRRVSGPVRDALVAQPVRVVACGVLDRLRSRLVVHSEPALSVRDGRTQRQEYRASADPDAGDRPGLTPSRHGEVVRRRHRRGIQRLAVGQRQRRAAGHRSVGRCQRGLDPVHLVPGIGRHRRVAPHGVVPGAVADRPARQAVRLEAHPVGGAVARDHLVFEPHGGPRDVLVVGRSAPAAQVQRQPRRPRHHHRLAERHRHFDGLAGRVG